MPPPDGVPEGAQQRESARVPVSLRVDYERMNSFFADYTKNISKGGTFIKTDKPLPVGTRLAFALSAPALSEPVRISGEVSWVLVGAEAAAKGQDPGMGIRFVFASEAERRLLEALVERMMEESLGPEAAKALLRK